MPISQQQQEQEGQRKENQKNNIFLLNLSTCKGQAISLQESCFTAGRNIRVWKSTIMFYFDDSRGYFFLVH